MARFLSLHFGPFVLVSTSSMADDQFSNSSDDSDEECGNSLLEVDALSECKDVLCLAHEKGKGNGKTQSDCKVRVCLAFHYSFIY